MGGLVVGHAGRVLVENNIHIHPHLPTATFTPNQVSSFPIVRLTTIVAPDLSARLSTAYLTHMNWQTDTYYSDHIIPTLSEHYLE